MDFLNLLQFGFIIKLFWSVLLFFYFIFAVVVYRQITLMTQILNSNISPVVRTVAATQILAVAFLFFIGLVLV